MPEKVVPGPVSEDRCIREAVCIHTKKIFDSCKEKDIALLIYIYILAEFFLQFSIYVLTVTYFMI